MTEQLSVVKQLQSDCHVLYFVKYPEPGHVKTRLAKVIGPQEAARCYKQVAEANLSRLQKVVHPSFFLIITYDPSHSEQDIRKWLPTHKNFRAQEGNDLGERLERACQRSFQEGAKRVMVLGSDTLDLREEIIERGFEALQRCDVVIGPAQDGGYYLIGCSRPIKGLFCNIPWSTNRVFQRTIQFVQSQQFSYECLAELQDLDDYKTYQQNQQRG